MKYQLWWLVSVALTLAVDVGTVRAQTRTPGQVTQFDPNLNMVDSVIAQDPNGRIGIGTATPGAALDVSTGDLNVAGNILSGGTLILYNNDSLHNTFVGKTDGNVSTTGPDDTAVGTFALSGNIDGQSDTAVGFGALALNDGS